MMKKDETVRSLGGVITGGSKGLGYALASVFLAAGDRVVICGRNQPRLEEALSSLRSSCALGGEVHGMVCDVGKPSDAVAFAVFASARLGRIDRWINNAGTSGQFKRPLWELHADDMLETCTTNLSGSIMLCAEAVRLMERQPSSSKPIYHIFNMGFSSAGSRLSRSAVPHKASKRGVAELTHFLARELKVAGKTSIGIHELSPGLVLTRLLLQDASESAIKLFDIIAERPEKVAAVLVPKIRSITGRNRHMRYQPLALIFFRLLIGIKQVIKLDAG